MGFGLGDLNPVRIVEGKGAIGESGLGGLVVGAGLAMMGVPPGLAALYTGGASALLTGDLKQGLFMGMGAYGGAGLMGGLEGLGEKELAEKAVGAEQLGGPGLESQVQDFVSPEVAGAEPTQLSGPGAPATPQATPINAAQTGQTVQTTTAAPGLEGVSQRMSNVGAGFDRLTSSGGIDALSKQIAANSANPAIGGPASLMGAAGWAGAGAIGTHKQDNPAVGAAQKPGYIRQFTYDPFGQRYNALTPVAADQWGSRSFQDAFRAADGGIVALARGGVAHFESGGLTADQAAAAQSWVAANPTATKEEALSAAAAAGYTPEQANAAWSQYGPTTAATPAAPSYTSYTPEQMGAYFSNPANANVNVADAVKQFNADPNAVNQYITGLTSRYSDPTATQRGSGYLPEYENLIKAGMTPAEYAAAAQGMNKDWGKGYWNEGTVGHAYDVANKILAFDPQTDKVTPSDKEWAAFMDKNAISVGDISRATGLTESEVQRRYDAAKGKPVVPTPVTPTYGTTPGGKTVDITPSGDRTVNPDGTVTVHPSLPGGGNFTGVGDVKDRYTAGGGSLGYVSPVVKSAAEHEAAYNKLTGGSKAAFDYLMGKAPYSATPYTATGEIMKPYSESVLGVPADNTRFAQRFNPTTRKYEANPDYKSFVFNQDTGQTTRGMNQAELKDFVADPKNLVTPPADSSGFFGTLVKQLNEGLLDRPVWMAQNNVSYEQLASALGISVAEAKKRYPAKATTAATGGLMGMASGGLGSLGGYSDGGRLLKGPGDGVSDSIPASIGDRQPARLADGEFVVPARIVSELGNGSTDAGARKLYQMMDRVQKARGKTTGKGKVATNSRADKYLPV